MLHFRRGTPEALADADAVEQTVGIAGGDIAPSEIQILVLAALAICEGVA